MKTDRTSRRSILRAVERLLLVLGVALLGTYGYFSLERTVYQWHHSRRLEQHLAGRSSPAPASLMHGPIGRIEIPRIGVSALILSGADDRTLQLGVGHIPGTDLPGESGNVGLAGHRDTFFRPLRKLQRSDTIRLTSSAGTQHYRVESMAVVEPDETSVLEAGNAPALTLVTCYPFEFVGRAPKRFVVRATKVDGSQPAPPPRLRNVAARSHAPRKPRAVPQSAQGPSEPVDTEQQLATIEPPKKRNKFLRTVSFPVRKTFGWLKR